MHQNHNNNYYGRAYFCITTNTCDYSSMPTCANLLPTLDVKCTVPCSANCS